MHDSLLRLIEWYRASLVTGGYPLIVLLMAIESSIVPLPSELVIPFAAVIAERNGGMSLPGIVAAGAVGSWIGAAAMYWASRVAGRPLVMRCASRMEGWTAILGRDGLARKAAGLALVTPAKVEQAERWSARFGNFGVFASRFLPVIRHLVGIPAGIVRLPFWAYSLCTLAGSATWCAVLAWVGLKAGQDEALMRGELHRILLWILVALTILGGLYWSLVVRASRHEGPARPQG